MTVGALLPIANPVSTAPVFVAITRRMSHVRRNQQARMAAIYMACILMVALLAGALILKFFGISLPALRMAGGLIIARIGFKMLDPAAEEALPEQDQREALDRRDIAFAPVAMPLLSGPGSIAVTISMATSVDKISDFIPVYFGIAIVAFISWLVLRSSSRIIGFMGTSGVNVLTRIMGLILVCVGIQFVANGFIGLLTDEAIASIFMEAYPD
ncbi:MAG: MarC family NAAT transporter [Gammaproteobacteria bacterium]|nr:MarC family NAAT transporter [Gammaproteobacteria bacterium]